MAHINPLQRRKLEQLTTSVTKERRVKQPLSEVASELPTLTHYSCTPFQLTFWIKPHTREKSWFSRGWKAKEMGNIKRNGGQHQHNDDGLRNYLTNNIIIIPTSYTCLWPLSMHTQNCYWSWQAVKVQGGSYCFTWIWGSISVVCFQQILLLILPILVVLNYRTTKKPKNKQKNPTLLNSNDSYHQHLISIITCLVEKLFIFVAFALEILFLFSPREPLKQPFHTLTLECGFIWQIVKAAKPLAHLQSELQIVFIQQSETVFTFRK